MMINPITIKLPRHALIEIQSAARQRLGRFRPGSESHDALQNALDYLEDAIRAAEKAKESENSTT